MEPLTQTSPEPELPFLAEPTAELMMAESTMTESAEPSPPPDSISGLERGTAWRGELSERLNRYRSRRKAPPPRYPSLRMPFDPLESRGTTGHLSEATLFPTFEPASNHALALDNAELGSAAIKEFAPVQPEDFVADMSPQADTHAGGRTIESRNAGARTTGAKIAGAGAGAKIIEFPRFAWGPPAPPPDQLAEPVSDRPRILEVPDCCAACAGPGWHHDRTGSEAGG